MNTQSYVSWSYTGSDHTGFKLERSTPESGSWTTVFTCSNAVTTYYDDAAWWGDVLLYRISAVNYWGTGPTSSIAPVFIVPPPADIWAWQHGTTTQSVVFWHFEGRHTMSLSRSSDGGSTWDWGIEIPPMTTTTYDDRSGYYYIDDTVSVGNTYTYRVQEIFSASIEPTSSLASVTIVPETSSRTVLAVTADAGFQYNGVDDTPWELHTASLHEANRVARQTFGAVAWILVGDNYYNAESPGTLNPDTYGGYEGQVGRLLGPSSSLYTCPGNHDYSDIGITEYHNYFHMFRQPGGARYYYTQSLGTTMLFSLLTIDAGGTALSESSFQWNWFSQSIVDCNANRPDITWKVAFVHVPVICSSGSHSPNPYLAAIPWETWGIDAVFSGHVHWVERIESSSVVFVNTSLMGSDKRSITTASLETKWWYTGEADSDYVWTLLEINSGSNHHVLSMSFYSGSTKVDDTGSTDIKNAMKVGYTTVLMKPWYAPPTASAIQSGEPTASVSWIFSGEFSQSLFRSVDSGSTWPVTYSIDPSVYSYEDTAVAVDTSYWYKVRHLLWPTEPYSNVAEVFISSSAPPVPPPEAPIFLMVTSGSAVLDWTSGSNDTEYYDIYKSVDDEFGTYSYLTSSVTTHHVDYDVTASYTYYYKVAAVNAGGSSSFSNIAELPVIACTGVDFAPYIVSGYLNHSNGSTYRHYYGVSVPFTTSISQSISVWGRSPDFDVYLTLADADGNVLIENDWDGWVPSGDVSFGNAAFAYELGSGSYTIEISSVDNAVGRYSLNISPGARLETSWSTCLEPTAHVISSSNCMFINDQGTGNLIWYDFVNRVVLTSSFYPYGCQGAVYSPTQDRCYAVVYYLTGGTYSASVNVFDHTGSLLSSDPYPAYYNGGTSQVSQSGDIVYMSTTTGLPDFTSSIFEHPTVRVGDRINFMTSPFPSVVVTEIIDGYNLRVSGSGLASPSTFRVVPVLSPYVDGYVCYDEVNDQMLICDYSWDNLQHAVIYDCATETLTASINVAALNASHYSIWMNAYSPTDNSFYLARTTYSPMIKIDATTFSSSLTPTAVNCEIVVSNLSGSDLMMIRGASDKVAIIHPVSASVVHIQTDLPSSGLFEGGGSGDLCSNTFVATIDTQGGPNVSAIALFDRSTYRVVNYLPVNNYNIGGFAPDGYFQYGIAFNEYDSRIYSVQQSYDDNTGRLYSIRASRPYAPISWSAPYTASAADTASCMWFSGSYKITSSVPGPTDWMGRAYPGYITSDGTTTVVSDNEYMLDGTYQHNRHNWFFSTDGQTRYNDYTESYIHTWPGRNAVVCNGKYYMLSDGTTYQSPSEEAITASTMLVFDSTGSLSASIALTHGAMDWDSDGKSVWVYEHDGINSYLEEITGSTSTIVNTQGIITDLSFNVAIISATASLANGLDYGYYYGKMLSFEDSNGSQWTIVNNVLETSAIESGSGDLLWSIQSGYFGGWKYRKSFADDGTTGFGGWMGSMCYCPLTDTVFIGVFGPSPDYVPMLIEVTPNMTLVSTRDLTELTASGIWAFDDIKWDNKKRVLALYNYWATVPGQTAIYDPVASTAVCTISPLEETGAGSIVGVSAGNSMGVNPVNGEMYFPQRFDGDYSALTGSVKTYVIEPFAIP